MPDPYTVLGLESHASQEAIRQQYLTLVRQYPPEREPQRFAEIRAAYDELNDPVTSLKRRLFELSTSETLDAIFDRTLTRLRTRRIATDLLLSLGK